MNIFDELLSCDELKLLEAIAPSDIRVDGLNQQASKIYAQSFIDSLWIAFEESRSLMSKDFKRAVNTGRALLKKSLSSNRAYYY